MTMSKKLNFEHEDKKLYVRMPNQKEINDGDLVYKTKYSDALRYGALSAAEANNIITKREIWTPTDDAEVRDLFIKLQELGEKLMGTDKFSNAAGVIFDMERVRTDILRKNMTKNNILDNTAESYADDHRLQFYCVACSYYGDDNPVFADVDDYLERAGEDVAKLCMTKLIHLIANDGKDFRSEWPEFQWRLKHGLIDEEMNPVKDKMDEFVRLASDEIIKDEPVEEDKEE